MLAKNREVYTDLVVFILDTNRLSLSNWALRTAGERRFVGQFSACGLGQW
jgi:hypothetical protein